MANLQAGHDAGLFAGRWCGLLSLVLGALAFLIFFEVRRWNVTALGEPVGMLFALAVTWLPVMLPVCGFGFGVLGIAKDRQNALAIIATIVNVLGLIVAGLILAILAG